MSLWMQGIVRQLSVMATELFIFTSTEYQHQGQVLRLCVDFLLDNPVPLRHTSSKQSRSL